MNFDSLAWCYRWLEYGSFGRALENCRFAFLPEVTRQRRALLLGEGDGRFLVRLLAVNPGVQVDVIDASAGMIEQARRRVAARATADLKRVQFQQEDARSWTPPPAAYDLLVTHFFLDCFEEKTLAALVPRIARAAAPGALWLFSDFQMPSGPVGRVRALLWLGFLYWFFRRTTGIEARRLCDPREFISQTGFRRRRQTALRGELLTTELWERDRRQQAAIM